jgi:hypothetical protein
VTEPVLVWRQFSPAQRAVRSLEPAASDLGMRAFGKLAIETCPATHEAIESMRATVR